MTMESMLIVMKQFSLWVMLFRTARQLAHEFGKAKREDDEVDAAKAERRKPDDERKEETDDRGKGQTDREVQADMGEGHRVHSDADEGSSGQRNVAGRAENSAQAVAGRSLAKYTMPVDTP